jgi:uncharacterized protein (TIGR03437 family)
MTKLCYTFALCLLLSICAFAQQASSPSDAGVPIVVTVSAASYDSSVIARGSIVAAFGDKIAGGTTTNSVSIVLLDSKGAVLNVFTFFAVTPDQVNFLIPDRLAEGAVQVIAINNTTGQQVKGSLTLANVAPGIFTANSSGRGVPAANLVRVKADGSQTTEPVARFDTELNRFVPLPIDNSVETDQLYLVLYGTGWRNRISDQSATAYIGSLKAEVKYVGAQGGFAGLDQMNILLPKDVPSGNYSINITVDGKAANEIVLTIR